MKRAAPLLLLLLLGCLKPEPIRYRIRLGMSEATLLEALGPPISARQEDGGKTLEYRSWGKNMRGTPVHPEDWYVHLSRGKVDGYGVHKTLVHPLTEGPKLGT
jgi:hypothetical protein